MSPALPQKVFICFFTEIVGYVNALAAQYHGAGQPERTVEAVSQGFWLSLASVPLLFLLIPVMRQGFAWAGRGPRQIALEYVYFRALLFGSPLFLIQSVLTGFFLGHGRTRMIPAANVLGILVKAPLNWCLEVHALECARPKHCYRVGNDPLRALLALLPASWADALIGNVLWPST